MEELPSGSVSGEYGLLIGATDLWIAATALALEMPLPPQGDRPFRGVPGLEVMTYS